MDYHELKAAAADPREFVLGLCSQFLAATPEERQRLYELCSCDEASHDLMDYAPFEKLDFSNTQQVMLCLAAISLENGRLDYRDTGGYVWGLHRDACSAGFDIRPVFRQMATIADGVPASSPFPCLSVASALKYPYPDLRRVPLDVNAEIEKSGTEAAAGTAVFYFRDQSGQAIGPLSARALRECRYKGLVRAETLVRQDSSTADAWCPADSFPEIFPRYTGKSGTA